MDIKHTIYKTLKAITEAVENGEYDLVLQYCGDMPKSEIINMLIELQGNRYE